jgi:hypothetical protein
MTGSEYVHSHVNAHSRGRQTINVPARIHAHQMKEQVSLRTYMRNCETSFLNAKMLAIIHKAPKSSEKEDFSTSEHLASLIPPGLCP